MIKCKLHENEKVTANQVHSEGPPLPWEEKINAEIATSGPENKDPACLQVSAGTENTESMGLHTTTSPEPGFSVPMQAWPWGGSVRGPTAAHFCGWRLHFFPPCGQALP